MNINTIFDFYGVLIIVLSILCGLGLSEGKIINDAGIETEKPKPTVSQAIKLTCSALAKEASIIVSLVGFTTGLIITTSTYTYGEPLY